MNRSAPLSLLLLTFLCLFQTAAHSQQLVAALPEDTLTVFAIHDLPSLEMKRNAFPLRHLPRFTSFETQNEGLQQVQKHWRTMKEQIDGEVVLSFSSPEPYLALRRTHTRKRQTLWDEVDLTTEDNASMDALLAAEETMRALENEALRATLTFQAAIRDSEAVQALLTEISETVNGLHWDIQNNILAVSFSQTGVAAVFKNLSDPASASLTAGEDFLDAMGALGRQDALVYINIPVIVNLLSPLLAELQGEMPTVDLSRVVDWLEPDAFLPMAFASYLDREALTLRSQYGFRRETGLSRLLLGTTDKPAPAPDFIHKEVDQVITTHWNLSETLQNIQQDLSRISPEIAVAFGFLKMTVNVNLGLDLDTQFLQTLGTGLTIATQTDQAVVDQLNQLEDLSDPAALLALTRQHPTGGIHYLVGLEVEDRKTFESSLVTLISTLTKAPVPGPVRDGDIEKTFLFTHLTTLPAELRTQIASTFLENHWLIAVGDTSMLNQARLALTQESERLWTRPDVIRSLETTGAQVSESALQATAEKTQAPNVLSYTSGRELRNTLRQLETLTNWISVLSGDQITFPDALPEHPLFENSLGTGVRDGHRLVNETRMRFAPEPSK